MTDLSLEYLWRQASFTPNDNQEAAIRHVDGPLYLPAGPGSGKTRVLLWRTVNLIVFHGIRPEDIFLSTFTEKAAHQLREGLRGLLGSVTDHNGVPYDLSNMYAGTVHSLCQRLLMDRRFYDGRQRGDVPALMDALGQYFYLYKTRRWNELTEAAGLDDNAAINSLFRATSVSKHVAVSNCISLFNRLSEERIDPAEAVGMIDNDVFRRVLDMYGEYKRSLLDGDAARRTDFSLLQQEAMRRLDERADAGSIFKHVIIDEYQHTNAIQEAIFFRLAQGHRNICAVGDDDQALYRFRGATVENFVRFPQRCEAHLGTRPRTIPLDVNYRSRQPIVDFYSDFIRRCDWSKDGCPTEHYRVVSKNIRAHRAGDEASVIASARIKADDGAAEIAGFVRRIIDEGKVDNPNQIAFLFPFLTIHQAKGLEFPVVVLGNPRKDDRGPQTVEELVNPLIDREGEPLDRMSRFDIMRMFYVALSRARNLLVIAHFEGRGQRINSPFKEMLDDGFPRIQDFDIDTLPSSISNDDELPKNYSYTGDYLLYQRCPRQYMIFRKYGFAPSRSTTMMFGSLVHQTMDDLHQFLISERSRQS